MGSETIPRGKAGRALVLVQPRREHLLHAARYARHWVRQGVEPTRGLLSWGELYGRMLGQTPIQ